jgi:hypothetical protein
MLRWLEDMVFKALESVGPVQPPPTLRGASLRFAIGLAALYLTLAVVHGLPATLVLFTAASGWILSKWTVQAILTIREESRSGTRSVWASVVVLGLYVLADLALIYLVVSIEVGPSGSLTLSRS